MKIYHAHHIERIYYMRVRSA